MRSFVCFLVMFGLSLHSYRFACVAPERGNAPNLSPTASGGFVRDMEVEPGFSGRPWIGT